MIFMAPILLLTSQLDMENPSVSRLFLIGFSSVQVASFLVIFYILYRIKKENNTTTEIATIPSMGKPSEVMTQEEYDFAEVKSLFFKTLFATLVSLFLFYKFSIVRHFGIQMVMNLVQLYGEPLFKIFVLGREADGDLKRPFKVDQGGFQKWLQDKMESTSTAEDSEEHKKNKEGKKKR